MQNVSDLQPFSFNYTAFDQNAGLFVAFNVYDVTTGTAVFVTQVAGALADFGSYMGSFTGDPGATYLVIGAVYTDGSYTTVDTNRAPSADIFQVVASQISYLGFAYASFDLNAALSVQASVFDMTTGSPVFVQTASMVLVAFGVYFGSFTGTVGKTYDILSVVYTDGTFTSVDPLYAPGSDEFDCFTIRPNITIVNTIQGGALIAPSGG